MYLVHYGVKGMHWGVRRYQNPDGSLTAAGRKKYSKSLYKKMSKGKNEETFKRELGILRQDPNYKKAINDVNRARTFSERNKAEDQYSGVTWNLVNNFVGKYGDRKITSLGGNYRNVVNRLLWKDTWGNTNVKSISKEDATTLKSLSRTSNKTPSMKGNPNKESDINAYNRRTAFMDEYKPSKGSKNTLWDIDDYELIDLKIDDPSFRKEYGVSDKDYRRYKKMFG